MCLPLRIMCVQRYHGNLLALLEAQARKQAVTMAFQAEKALEHMLTPNASVPTEVDKAQNRRIVEVFTGLDTLPTLPYPRPPKNRQNPSSPHPIK